MRNDTTIASLILSALAFTALSSAAPTVVLAHEAHKATCDETAMNSVNADIQAMDDGEVKTKAMKEMEMAEEMMGKDDMKGCETHMHNAMEATEE